MNASLRRKPKKPEIIYPDSDGQPMAENTLQFTWIVMIKENLETMFEDREDVFVAGDLLWYPVQGEPKIRQAPDTLVAFGRPKGYRGSYRQWEEGGIAPQVLFEVLSPGNRLNEMTLKFQFYERYGIEEYYVYDPENHELNGWLRQGDKLVEIPNMNGWTSPRLGIRFEINGDELIIYRPDNQRFTSHAEETKLRAQAEKEREHAEKERDHAEKEKNEAVRLVQEQAEEVARLRERLKALGENADG